VQGNGKGIPATTAACVDAETLAAWADGALPKVQAAAVEMHLADCERCTAMVATFARTIPDTPVAESLWTRWHLRWLVPLATAATVAALWVLVPRPESPQTTIGRVPTTESQAAAAAESAQPSTASEPKEQETQTAAPAPSKPADTFAKREEPRQAPRQLADQRQADSDTAANRLPSAPLSETIAIVPPPPREADRAEAKSADEQTERFSRPTPSANAAPPAAPSPAVPEASTARAPAAASPPAALGAAASAQARAVASPAREQAAIVEVVSPDPMTRWRVVGAGRVERSTNGGRRWEAATLPESATLIAGSSPSPSICWLVGRTGSIYVTTDGLRFVRVPFLDRTDFVSIQATDGRRATVVTIDGRTMRTEDQGVTWIRITP
jgi:putative zinc finger protein